MGCNFTADEISLVGSRLRLMLSHLWKAKRSSNKPGRRFEQLQGLIDAMAVSPSVSTTAGSADKPESVDDDCGSDGSDVEVMDRLQSVISVSTEECGGELEDFDDGTSG